MNVNKAQRIVNALDEICDKDLPRLLEDVDVNDENYFELNHYIGDILSSVVNFEDFLQETYGIKVEV